MAAQHSLSLFLERSPKKINPDQNPKSRPWRTLAPNKALKVLKAKLGNQVKRCKRLSERLLAAESKVENLNQEAEKRAAQDFRKMDLLHKQLAELEEQYLLLEQEQETKLALLREQGEEELATLQARLLQAETLLEEERSAKKQALRKAKKFRNLMKELARKVSLLKKETAASAQ